MTETTLKYRIGWFLVLLHIVVILVLLTFYAKGGFSFDQLTTAFAVIVPMFAGYTTAIVSFIVSDRFRGVDDSKQVTGTFAAMSFLFPGIFGVLVIGAISLQAFTLTFDNFEQFKQILILIEGLFAIYVGRFVYSMFERVRDADTASLQSREPASSSSAHANTM